MSILIDILVVIAGIAVLILCLAPVFLATYVAYKRLTAPVPLKKEPIDLNFQPTPELQRAYEADDWSEYDRLMGEYLSRPPDRSLSFTEPHMELIDA